METRDIGSYQKLEQEAKNLYALVSSSPSSVAVVVALHGDLGAGKTTFVQQLALCMGITQTVTSPTFVVMKQYSAESENDSAFDTLVHIDAYRIESLDEMRPLRFEELLEQERTFICIEWAERIEALLPAQTLHLHFSAQEDRRTLSY